MAAWSRWDGGKNAGLQMGEGRLHRDHRCVGSMLFFSSSAPSKQAAKQASEQPSSSAGDTFEICVTVRRWRESDTERARNVRLGHRATDRGRGMGNKYPSVPSPSWSLSRTPHLKLDRPRSKGTDAVDCGIALFGRKTAVVRPEADGANERSAGDFTTEIP